RVVHRHQPLLGAHGLRAWEAYVFRRWAAEHLGARNAASALRAAWQRSWRQPFSPEGWWILFKSVRLHLLGGPAPATKQSASRARTPHKPKTTAVHCVQTIQA